MPITQVIAIDGPSGVGKSTVAKAVANHLGWTYLDTGATYRAVTLAWLEADSDPSLLEQPTWLQNLGVDFQAGDILLGTRRVNKAIREPEVTANASFVSAQAAVRTYLTELQRQIARKRPCILDGRDIGTVVFPDALLKVFLTADDAVRAKRRWYQIGGDQANQTLDEVLTALQERDRKDSSRTLAPLKPAKDAWTLETNTLSQEEVIDRIECEARRRFKINPA
ncbi:(d)CMP kinase [Acanthopleuribacter pedis]|uniref:Cytidylate kinase n=1 Tax=Acanthopleuribacter pedis TaxID=442870 RepID=A0A8J7QD84_9BACT|nr:(d)CMP kinase [Acanthopleuribacter pedis]MBO1316928.1 (d)CMP kinase [Acanthopleuribacter pedis]